MKKMILSVICMAAIGFAFITSSCTITPEQAKVIANQSGTIAVVSWIAAQNPSTNEMDSVNLVISAIKNDISLVGSNSTYSAVLYPLALDVIKTQVLLQYRPLCKIGTSSLLGALDMIFIIHPDWQANKNATLSIVSSFMQGVQDGLTLSEKDIRMIKARNLNRVRAKMIQ